MNNFEYTFVLGDHRGAIKCTHDEYLKNWELRAMVNPEGMSDDMKREFPQIIAKDYYRLFLGRTIFCIPLEVLADDKDTHKELEYLRHDQERNPLKYYSPNNREQLDFINDDDGTVLAIVDANRVGKTSAAYIKLMVMDPPMFPLDPTWPIFVDHGVKWREWKGPISVGVATYNVAKLGDPIWKEMIRKWTPDSELGVYGRTYKGKGAKYGPSMNHEKLIRLHSGSDIGFYTYEMDQGNYEGAQLKRWLWDEQGEKAKWDGADRGTRTTGGKHIFSLTPHKVEGRPDTGGSGWLREFLDGVDTMGHTVKKYGSKSINDVPDWIYPEKSKAIEFEKWYYGPKRTGNRKMIAEGRARLFAEWHFSEGLVFDEWYPEVHWIDPLWEKPPEDYTLYRAIDHGMKDPTVCLWFAVAPDGTIYLYRCYYQINKTIYENVANIIAMSGNERKKLSVARISDNFHLDSFEEVMVGEGICKTILDSRSFSAPDGSSGKPMGWIYKQAGFQNSRLAQASGKNRHTWVPMINQLLHVDDGLISPATGHAPGARMYWFNNCLQARREIEQYVYQENTDRPIDKNDHVATALAYAVQIPLRYAGGQNMWRMPKAQERVMAGGNFWDDPLDKKGKKVPDYGYRPIGG